MGSLASYGTSCWISVAHYRKHQEERRFIRMALQDHKVTSRTLVKEWGRI